MMMTLDNQQTGGALMRHHGSQFSAEIVRGGRSRAPDGLEMMARVEFRSSTVDSRSIRQRYCRHRPAGLADVRSRRLGNPQQEAAAIRKIIQ